MPQRRHIDDFERVTRRKVYIRDKGGFNIFRTMTEPVVIRSLEQVLRDDRAAKAVIRQEKRAEMQRSKIEKQITIEREQQRRREQEAAALQQKIQEGVNLQAAEIKQRAFAVIRKYRDKYSKETDKKIALQSKIAQIKRKYDEQINRLKSQRIEAKRPAQELQRKWSGKDGSVEFNGIHPYGVYM